MDIAKDVDGHILVIPKKHCKNILDCDADTLSAVAQTVKTVSNHLADHCGYDGINLLNASDESAGQSVPHFHIHIIPRKRDDGIDAWPKFEGAKEDIQAVFDKVRVNTVTIDGDDATWNRNIEERNKRIEEGNGGSDFYVDEGLLNKLLSMFEIPEKAEMDVWYELNR
ncbi:HIT domain-containing protein [Butyrivibrio sp. DSM 10294]|nr:HIT domain-containing protein [Butyrivibrio sp. DSM 10294]MDC7293808.1 HIT domain-containing protein [Butyrivibrio sp. DSM 10294]